MAHIQRVEDEQAAAALAAMLNGNGRRKPVVVVTIPAGREHPWIDIDNVAHEAGSLADVYLIPTGHVTWELSRLMPEGTGVYGGAGRVYPVGHEWTSILSRSPLRFAFNAAEGQRATQALISDALRMAVAAGLLRGASPTAMRPVDGTVQLVVAHRALVDIGNHFPAGIAEELTATDVPIERIVEPGQEIRGWYDPETNRIDVTKSLRPSSEALAQYSPGDVVLTKVAKVKGSRAELVLYPKTSTPPVAVKVLRADVTSNPADDLRTLMTIDEVIPARVVTTGPNWTLKLSDIDDDEAIVPAPSLLPGGPPWLTEEPAEYLVDEPPVLQPPAPRAPMPRPLITPAEPEPETAEEEVQVPRPTPALFDKNRPKPGTKSPAASPTPPPSAPSPEPAASTRSLLLKIDGLTAEVNALKAKLEKLQGDLFDAHHAADGLRYLLDQQERRANRAENELKGARARLRKASGSKPSTGAPELPVFADREQGFRYLVLTQWANRTLPSEQSQRPLKDYLIGPAFLDSLDELEGIRAEKVAGVVFEIVTGLAPQIPSREVHQLRSSAAGDSPTRVREDGARAWRASLQVNTPSARRIHYWSLPDGTIELARVGTHDSFDI